MNAHDTVILARKNLGGIMESSARLNLSEAVEALNVGNLDAAKASAIRSLRYSVGIFHADYRRAVK